MVALAPGRYLGEAFAFVERFSDASEPRTERSYWKTPKLVRQCLKNVPVNFSTEG